MSNSFNLFAWILNLLFGEVPEAELTRTQRRVAQAVHRRMRRRYVRYVKHVEAKLGPKAIHDPKFRELVAETAAEYSREF